MTSRLDQIFSFVNEIELRTNRLTSVVNDSNDLINSITTLNASTIEFDDTIDDIRLLMNKNNESITEFKNLHEKAFYLESNLLHNDEVTNQQSFEHITQEYMHILGKLQENDKYNTEDQASSNTPLKEETQEEEIIPQQHSCYISEEPQPEEQPQVQEPFFNHSNPPDLKKMISISNLKLKPMRCTSATSPTISKKKSRYRLSSIYNINPIAYEESTMETSVATSSTSSGEHTITSDSHEVDHSRMQNSVTYSYETLDSHIMNGTTDLHGNMTPVKISPEDTETPLNEVKATTRGRSNSLPTISTKDNSVPDNDILKEFDCEDDILRLNRLKHFISVSNLPGKHYYDHDYQDDTGSDYNHKDDVFFDEIYTQSPTPQARRNNINDGNYDVVSIVSDFSYYSPEKQEHQLLGTDNDDIFDYNDFSDFLRKSRLDLNKDLQQAFPHLMPAPQVKETQRYKFHNPIEKQLTSSMISTATLDVQASAILNNKIDPNNNKLSYRPGATSTSITNSAFASSSPSASSILHSYMQNPKTTTQQSNESTHSFSFNDGFFKLYHSISDTPKKTSITPPKIKELKKSKMIKSNPILIPNEAQLKRIPPSRTDGSVSKLIIGSNQTKTIRHGDGSIFKNPVAKSYDYSALRDALASSILD